MAAGQRALYRAIVEAPCTLDGHDAGDGAQDAQRAINDAADRTLERV